MGIYNRDYIHHSTESSTASAGPSAVTKIIFATIGIFLIQMATARSVTGDSLTFEWLALERDLVFRSGHIWRFLTYAFCHSETRLMHIVCNMFALFFVGRIVANKVGDREFLWLYLASAVFAGIVQACSMAIFRAPGQDWALGASGAVSAVFVLFAMHYPRLKLYIFGLVPIQARWLLVIALAYDGLGFLGVVPSIFVGDGAKIGHAAHLGGVIFGFLYFRWNMNLTSWWDQVAGRTRTTRSASGESEGEVAAGGFNLRVYNPGSQPDISYADRVDEILDKISRDGEASLTDRERRILTQASEHLNRTR